MKKIFKTFLIIGLVASATSCKKYLDVNTNPNDLTSATPDIILPQALEATGVYTNTCNETYGGDLGGYMAGAGGIGLSQFFISFTFANNDNSGIWTGAFDNLQDYQYILDGTTATGDYKYFNAIARLMKAYDYMKLVDAFGDVPYTSALKGANAPVTPTYDKGYDVYKACITEIDAAITSFRSPATPTTVNVATGSLGKIDITYYSGLAGGTNTALSAGAGLTNGLVTTNWIKLANTLKLRALLHIQKATDASSTSIFASEKASMSALTSNDFIGSDVLINPGFQLLSGKTNPLWNNLGFLYTGTTSSKSYVPTKFVVGFYDGNKLLDGVKANSPTTPTTLLSVSDAGRGNLIYRNYYYKNQLGQQSTDALIQAPSPAQGGAWYTGTAWNTTSSGTPISTSATGYGVMKGFDMGIPLMTAAESFFLQAEGQLIGLTPLAGSSVASLFTQGISASFAYLDKPSSDIYTPTSNGALSLNVAAQLAKYQSDNSTSPLVNFTDLSTNLATTPELQLEAIITQKYIALNMINCDEGWNDFRRTYNATLNTGYPRNLPPSATAGVADPIKSFAPHPQSIGTTRSDGLAGRILYPSSETSYNTANVPVVNQYTDLVFYDARPKQ